MNKQLKSGLWVMGIFLILVIACFNFALSAFEETRFGKDWVAADRIIRLAWSPSVIHIKLNGEVLDAKALASSRRAKSENVLTWGDGVSTKTVTFHGWSRLVGYAIDISLDKKKLISANIPVESFE